MDYRINQQERDALKGLPHLARLTYLEALRPYMDFATGVIGQKRGISYQSLREELYVEPRRGNTGGSPSREQMRRVVKALEKAGLVSVQSQGKRLILQCLLATWDFSAKNLADSFATHKVDSKKTHQNSIKTSDYRYKQPLPDTAENALPDTPPESGINIIFLQHAFEKFWSIYPVKQSRTKAWEIFQALSPSQALSQTILDGLTKQIEHYNQAMAKGQWMPNWKHASNWLIQHCWEDALFETQGNDHARYQANNQQSESANLLWESCKDGFVDDGDTETTEGASVIDFKKYRHSTH